MKPIALFASLLLLTCLGIASVASLPDIDVLDKDVIEKIYRLHSLYTDGNTDPRVIEESLLRDIQSAGQWALTGFHVYDNNFSPRLGLPRDSFATLPEWLRFEHGQKYRPKIEEILRDRLQEVREHERELGIKNSAFPKPFIREPRVPPVFVGRHGRSRNFDGREGTSFERGTTPMLDDTASPGEGHSDQEMSYGSRGEVDSGPRRARTRQDDAIRRVRQRLDVDGRRSI